MWGRGEASSAMSSMSKNTAPGMWAMAYWARASPEPGISQEPSTTRTSGASRRSASQAVETRGSGGWRSMPSDFYIQGGIGKPFSRRKAGLKSLDW